MREYALLRLSPQLQFNQRKNIPQTTVPKEGHENNRSVVRKKENSTGNVVVGKGANTVDNRNIEVDKGAKVVTFCQMAIMPDE